jgi:mRNA-degrading endonuclease RelE of RelBE toxin-antitoxin system
MEKTKIQIIRTAFRKIQKLSHEYFEDVADILLSMNLGELGDRKKLKGYDGLWRTRKGDTRVVWCKYDTGILIVGAGKRDTIYQELLKNPDVSNPYPLNAVLEIEEEKINEIPTYEWDSYIHNSWYSFIHGEYLRYPILTHSQKSILQEIKNNPSQLRQNPLYTILLQSPAGTGKTICSTLCACDNYKTHQWNTFIILPKNLIDEVKKFHNVAKIADEDNVFIGTLREFFVLIASDELKGKLASNDEELNAFKKEALRVNIIDKNNNFRHNKRIQLSERELFLYRAFVDRRHGFRHGGFSFYEDNREIITKLREVKRENFKENLAEEKLTWLDWLDRLKREAIIPYTQHKTSLIIFDEAQDHLLDEYRTLISILKKWREEDRERCFISLVVGDRNQCVKPTDFHWGRLQLSKTYNLKYNYRNSEHIVRFSNIFWQFAKDRSIARDSLPKPSNPSDSFETGEPVRLLECLNKEEATSILKILDEKVETSIVNKKSIFSKLSKKLPIITVKEVLGEYPNLECINIEQAKGREFDSCVTFCLFQGSGDPSIEEANNWYTASTRPRYRLLVISTSEEIERLGKEKFYVCDHYNFQSKDESLEWITEWASSDYLLKDTELIINLILDGFKNDPMEIYWDTYSALRKANASKEQINEMEKEAIKILTDKTKEEIDKQLMQLENIASDVDKIPLKCLLLRGLSCSWQAIDEISKLTTISSQEEEYYRLIYAIANDLESRKLFYEAIRVKSLIDPIESLSLANFPFCEEIVAQKGSIASLLCKAAISKINIL